MIILQERLKELRKTLALSQEKFGAALGVTKTAICALESGRRNVTRQMVVAICREFNVNENWLLTGNGEMFNELSRAELAARIVGNALRSDNDFVLNTFIALGQLSPDDWQIIEKIIDKIKH